MDDTHTPGNGDDPVTIEAMNGKGVVVIKEWPRLLSIKLAAAYLGTTVSTIDHHKGRLPGRRKMGSRVVFDRVALDRMIDRAGGLRDLWVDAERLCQ